MLEIISRVHFVSKKRTKFSITVIYIILLLFKRCVIIMLIKSLLNNLCCKRDNPELANGVCTALSLDDDVKR